MISQVLIGIGSNLGNRFLNIKKSLYIINKYFGQITSCANIIETKPLGPGNYDYLNTVIICETYLKSLEMLQNLQDIEKYLGRVKNIKWDDRIIDLDILIWQNKYENLILKSSQINIPHKDMLKREFVMIPATQIAGDWIHPIINKKLKDI